MTISSTLRKAGPFPGDGAAVVFPFTFKVFAPTDVVVVRADVLGVESTLTQTSQYVVALNPDQDTTPGGSVTLLTPLAVGTKLSILSDVPQLQPVDLTNMGGFYPSVVNEALDRLTAMVQQMRELVQRTIRIPVTAVVADGLALPTPKKNQILVWGPDGTTLTSLDPATLIQVVTYGNAIADKFNGDGVNTSFTLSSSPGVSASMRISIDGVVQVPGDDFVWTGSYLNFVVAPPAGTRILAQYQQALPPQGSNAAIDLSNVDPATGRTSLSVPSLAALAASTGALLMGWIQSGTGAIARFVRDKLRDHMAAADFGQVGDATNDDAPAIRAGAAALAARGGGKLYVKGRAKLGSSLGTIPSLVTLWGDGPNGTTLIKAFNGDVLTLADGAGLENIGIDGQGATYTGKGILHSGGNQTVRRVKVANTQDTPIYFATGEGSRCDYHDVEPYQYGSAPGAGKYAIVIQDVLTGGCPRHFSNIKSGGAETFDFGGANDLFITNSAIYDCKWSINSRNVCINGTRIASVSQLDVKGSGSIVGCDIGSKLSLKANTAYVIGPNLYNNGWEDLSGNSDNLIYAAAEQTHTPVITAGGVAITVGTGATNTCGWTRQGRRVVAQYTFLPSASTVVGTGQIAVTLPIPTTAPRTQLNVNGEFFDTGGAFYRINGKITPAAPTVVQLERDTSGPVTKSSPGNLGGPAVGGGFILTVEYDV